MPKIQIRRTDSVPGDIVEKHLINQQLIDPSSNAAKLIMYAEKRYLWTFLVSGVVDPRYTAPGMANMTGGAQETAKTVIGKIPDSELIDDNARKYIIMGRIQENAVILSQVGTSTMGTSSEGGYFSLKMNDDVLYPGMNVLFFNQKMARVIAHPTGTKGNFVYRFQCYQGDTFSYATWVAPQPGTKTCFGGFTTYGEKSIRGYARFYGGTEWINHVTIQRKSWSISGTANVRRVLHYDFMGEGGYVYEAEAQMRAQFLLEDDFQKTWGMSTMRDSITGELLSNPSMIDHESGLPLIAGDGFVEQIKGQNDLESSGVAGAPTWEDLEDWVQAAVSKRNELASQLYYIKTGRTGIKDVQRIAYARFGASNPLTQIVGQTNAIGGADVTVGYQFYRLNVNGEQLYFVLDPQQDDEMKWPARCTGDGELKMSRTFYMINAGVTNGQRNIEILARGRDGINRNLVYLSKNGMTGEGQAEEPIDAKSFHWLKENNIFVYDTRSNGIMKPPATA